jgi:hypothetical protein
MNEVEKILAPTDFSEDNLPGDCIGLTGSKVMNTATVLGPSDRKHVVKDILNSNNMTIEWTLRGNIRRGPHDVKLILRRHGSSHSTSTLCPLLTNLTRPE